MSCPGLHCPGCSGTQSLGVLAATAGVVFVAYETVAVVAEYIVPIAITVAVCFALTVAASVWLERWSDRRCAAWGAARGIRSRADVILPGPERAPAVFPAAGPPAIGPVYHFNFYGPAGDTHAAIIRKAIAPGPDSPYPRQPDG